MKTSKEPVTTPEPLDKSDVRIVRMALGAAGVGLALKLGAPAKVESTVNSIDAAARALMDRGNTPARVATDDPGVPDATMDYLKGLPTEEAEVPAGGGLDDPAYAVDGARLNQSADLKEGIHEILDAQVPHTEAGVAVPQAGQELDVPKLPPIGQVPPEAR